MVEDEKTHPFSLVTIAADGQVRSTPLLPPEQVFLRAAQFPRSDFTETLAMVELQPVTAEDAALEAHQHQGGDMENHGLVDVMRDMTRDDGRRVHALVERHAELTGDFLCWPGCSWRSSPVRPHR